MESGKVKWFNSKKGFGFVSSRDGDFFCHFSNILGQPEGHRNLHVNDLVKFEVGTRPDGRPQAINITVTRPALKATAVAA